MVSANHCGSTTTFDNCENQFLGTRGLPAETAASHVNFGTLTLRVSKNGHDRREAGSNQQPITVIVSGVGRSGTSMVAQVLSVLGVPMGRTNNQAVFEDEEFLAALLYFDHQRLASLISSRNAVAPRWGFKFASLQNHILPPQLLQFRNPHMIIIMRDPVATASRSSMSDPGEKSGEEAFVNVSKQLYDMMYFVEKAECPTLLLSYEKFVSFPDKAIDAIVEFCAIDLTPQLRAAALNAIVPNNPAYIKLFHHDFRGNFDGVENGRLCGWCSHQSDDARIEVELLADGQFVAATLADLFRADLHAHGIGDGCHGFAFDIEELQIDAAAVLRVQVAGGEYILEGSDYTLNQMHKSPEQRVKEFR